MDVTVGSTKPKIKSLLTCPKASSPHAALLIRAGGVILSANKQNYSTSIVQLQALTASIKQAESCTKVVVELRVNKGSFTEQAVMDMDQTLRSVVSLSRCGLAPLCFNSPPPPRWRPKAPNLGGKHHRRGETARFAPSPPHALGRWEVGLLRKDGCRWLCTHGQSAQKHDHQRWGGDDSALQRRGRRDEG